MNFGTVSGLVNGTESIVFDYEVAGSAVTSISTGSILNGDEDCWYTVIARHIYDTDTSTLQATFNTDTTASNYGYLGIKANNTTTSSMISDSALIQMASVSATTTLGLSTLRFHSKQGTSRLINGMNLCNSSDSVVTQLELVSSVWNNSDTNITSMTFTPSAGKCAVGTRVIVLKSNNFAGGTSTGVINTPYIKGSWVRVGSSILTGAATSVTFSGLDGDRDVVYLLKHKLYQATTHAGGGAIFVRYNADGGHNYYQQHVNSVSAASSRFDGHRLDAGYCNANTTHTTANMLLFADSGFLRPSLCSSAHTISGTTIANITYSAGVWNNTAANLTSIVVASESVDEFAIGSQFELYALRPNG